MTTSKDLWKILCDNKDTINIEKNHVHNEKYI